MKAAIYARCSTTEQATEGFSISAQLTQVQEYCLKNNIEVHEFYSDEGISGTKEDRPAFQKMILDAEKGLFNVILVHKFDRFARKVEISQRIKSRLKKASVNVISITEPIEDSPIGFFQEGLLELLSEYFIKNLSNEIKKGQKERASQGHHHGSVPYGYGTKDGIAYIIEEEAKVVRQIFELYLQGKGYSKIALHLNYSEIPTKTGKMWQHHQVDRILKNPVYTGRTVLNGQVFESSIPLIISKEDYDAAQRDRGIKGEKYTYRASNFNDYLLLGLLRCGECGCAMRLSKSYNKAKRYAYFSYVCNMAARYHLQHKCSFNKHFQTKKLEATILAQLQKIKSDSSIEIIRKTKIVDIVDNYADKISKELERAKKAYLQGVFELEEYTQIRSKLEKDLKELSNNTCIPQVDIRDNIKNAIDLLNQYDESDIINRKKILRTIIEYISISKNGINIYFL